MHQQKNRATTGHNDAWDGASVVRQLDGASVVHQLLSTLLVTTCRYFIEKLVGLGADDGVALNRILFSVFFLMGVHPIIFSSLMVPSLRSSNNVRHVLYCCPVPCAHVSHRAVDPEGVDVVAQGLVQVPAWPFLVASFVIGIFGIFPYICVWQPRVEKNLSPPASEELELGFGRFFMRGLESRWLPGFNLAVAAALLYYGLSAGIPEWNRYSQLFDESKFVHVMSIDLIMCTALQPFLLSVDAEARGWEPRSVGVPVLSFLPFVGPLVYLLLRPITVRGANTEDAPNEGAGAPDA
jgi:hypothetical protein